MKQSEQMIRRFLILMTTAGMLTLLWGCERGSDPGGPYLAGLPSTNPGTDPSPGDGTDPSPGDGTDPTDNVLPEGDCQVGTIACEVNDLMVCQPDMTWSLYETCDGQSVCDPVAGACACIANCDMKSCGSDGCGGSCGTCPEGQACGLEGSCQDGPSCNPNGTGTTLGAQIADTTFTIQDGSSLNLHSFCGSATAILVVESAGW